MIFLSANHYLGLPFRLFLIWLITDGGILTVLETRILWLRHRKEVRPVKLCIRGLKGSQLSSSIRLLSLFVYATSADLDVLAVLPVLDHRERSFLPWHTCYSIAFGVYLSTGGQYHRPAKALCKYYLYRPRKRIHPPDLFRTKEFTLETDQNCLLLKLKSCQNRTCEVPYDLHVSEGHLRPEFQVFVSGSWVSLVSIKTCQFLYKSLY